MKIYSVYHLNMMFSSIGVEKRKEVVEKCYWPLLNLAKDFPGCISIEAPALTLEIIKKIDPNWIIELKKLIGLEIIEFIGSGYSQIIGPLVPAEVNEWNQKIGLDVYKDLLGIKPTIVLVNEMAYSAGMIEHYSNSGYKAIIMEWNNPRKYNPDWNENWKYYPQLAKGINNQTIPVIWADCIAFQKFQRYVHGEYSLNKYIKYLDECIIVKNGYFPLYTSDCEIFDFRPNRYKTEAKSGNTEWKIIKELYYYLRDEKKYEFVFPSESLKSINCELAGNQLSLESAEQPIPVKKQEKYNINRWALTGRNDLQINSKCYEIYQSLVKNECKEIKNWSKLCYLWSSDFRTHITENRWNRYLEELNALANEFCKSQIDDNLASDLNNPIEVSKGNVIKFENENINVALNKRKGFTIEELSFKKINLHPLIGKLPLGYYSDISLGADFFSGHTVIEKLGEHKIASLNSVAPIFSNENTKYVSKVVMKFDDLTFSTCYYLSNKTFSISRKLQIPERRPYKINFFAFTFLVDSWDINSLYFATHNGGSKLEKFYLKDQDFSHNNPVSLLITAKHGLGATEGEIFIGDDQKELKFKFYPSLSRLIPSVVFQKSTCGRFFLRLNLSAGEVDDTFRENNCKTIVKNTVDITAYSKMTK